MSETHFVEGFLHSDWIDNFVYPNNNFESSILSASNIVSIATLQTGYIPG